MRKRHRGVLPGLMAVVLLLLAACGPSPQPKVRGAHEWDDGEPLRAEITGDLDEAEARWRSELEETRWEDGARLFDDDPSAALRKSTSLTLEEAASAEKNAAEEAPPAGDWGRFKAGANAVGRAGFAAMTVLLTVGMMVAPYLLL